VAIIKRNDLYKMLVNHVKIAVLAACNKFHATGAADMVAGSSGLTFSLLFKGPLFVYVPWLIGSTSGVTPQRAIFHPLSKRQSTRTSSIHQNSIIVKSIKKLIAESSFTMIIVRMNF